MGRWYNVNDLGRTSESSECGRLDLQRAVVGDDAVAVIQNTVNTLHDLYFRAIGRPPYPRELDLMWNEVVHPQPEFPRCPESEVL
jgi:hypothetical protein